MYVDYWIILIIRSHWTRICWPNFFFASLQLLTIPSNTILSFRLLLCMQNLELLTVQINGFSNRTHSLTVTNPLTHKNARIYNTGTLFEYSSSRNVQSVVSRIWKLVLLTWAWRVPGRICTVGERLAGKNVSKECSLAPSNRRHWTLTQPGNTGTAHTYQLWYYAPRSSNTSLQLSELLRLALYVTALQDDCWKHGYM